MNKLPYVLALALVSTCIEIEMSVPSFLSIMQHFAVSKEIVGLTITLNLVGFCLASVIYGPLSDRWGRRDIMLIGNGILLLGAMACTLAPNIYFLLCARFVQGVGAATSAVLVSAIIADRYDDKTSAELYSVMNAFFSIMMALSPIIGAYIHTQLGWRGNYGMVAVLCVLSWLMLYCCLPETHISRKKLQFKRVLQTQARCLSNRFFLFSAIVPSLLYGCYLAFVAMSPFIYRQTFELDNLNYAIHLFIVVLSFALSSVVVGKKIHLFSSIPILISILVIAPISVSVLSFSQSSWIFTLAMSLFSCCFACLYPVVFTWSMSCFPKHKGASASIIMSLRYLICSLLITLAGAAFTSSIFLFNTIIFVVITLSSYMTGWLIYSRHSRITSSG